MTDEPFGRQPQPVQIAVIAVTGALEDIAYWISHIKRACEFKGDLVERRGLYQLVIYPRAVND